MVLNMVFMFVMIWCFFGLFGNLFVRVLGCLLICLMMVGIRVGGCSSIFGWVGCVLLSSGVGWCVV